MDWPSTPVEHLSDFKPPFCPWPECSEHLRPRSGYRCRRHGSYSTDRRRKIPRFLCWTCRRTFSRQTFSTSYYLKRPALLRRVAAGIVAGSALRQIARSLECAPNTVARMGARLGRHAMLFHATATEQIPDDFEEPFDFDHFETFELAQDYPFGIGTPVGDISWYFYDADPAPHGRGGRRSAAQQKRLRLRPERSTYGRHQGSMRRVLDRLLRLVGPDRPVELSCDGHLAYERAVASHPERRRIVMRSYPNPKRGPKGSRRSREEVERDRAMFSVDLLHKILRHTLAHHRRETIAFSRRLNAAMEQIALTMVWRNFVKRRSERRRGDPTPAMVVGLADRPWDWKRVLSRRLFFNRVDLSDTWKTLYCREWTTPNPIGNARHDLVRAF